MANKRKKCKKSTTYKRRAQRIHQVRCSLPVPSDSRSSPFPSESNDNSPVLAKMTNAFITEGTDHACKSIEEHYALKSHVRKDVFIAEPTVDHATAHSYCDLHVEGHPSYIEQPILESTLFTDQTTDVLNDSSGTDMYIDEFNISESSSRNTDRRVYCNKRMNCKQRKISRKKPANNYQNMKPLIPESSDERRIVDLRYFLENIKAIIGHSEKYGCKASNLELISEKKIGLMSKLKLTCNMCNSTFYVNTCNSKPKENLDINTSAVCGITASGIGFSQFEESMAAMNVQSMSPAFFHKINNNICEEWEKTAAISMAAAAEKERQAAIDEGRVKDGIAVIDVYVDGCWSKRSYKTNYSALSGAAAIVGRKFGEVLYLGVKNIYCSVCARASNKGTTPKMHKCFKNYEGPSTGMESEIILEGFKKSVSMYNIIYGRMIGDGDSSTYSKILKSRPYTNVTVEKIECRNHLLRNMCNKLIALTKDLKYPLVSRKLLTTQRVLAIRKAICLSIKEYKNGKKDLPNKINDLYVDITNSYNHAFGDHENCKEYYCQSQRISENLVIKLKTSAIWRKIHIIVGIVAGNSRSLINDVDSNTVERFNGIIAKLIGGKRINFSQRQSYQSRCSAAVISFNTSRPVYKLQKAVLGVSPKSKSNILERNRVKKNILNKKYLRPKKLFERKSKRDTNYGDNCTRPDLSPDDLCKLKTTFLKNLERSDEDRANIENTTILQRDSSEWLELRRQLITASNFGIIIKRRKTTNSTIVKSLLYNSNISNVASIKHGVDNEKIALSQLSLQEGVQISTCGLFIDDKIPFLGATPDGLIGDDTLVEIKCPISAYKSSLEEAVQQNKIGFWSMKGNEMTINKRHNWFFQIQGQLHIANRKTCLLAVWSGDNRPVKVELIYYDDDFWEKHMVEKLTNFYIDHVLPELVDPRQIRNMPIRQPATTITVQTNKNEK